MHRLSGNRPPPEWPLDRAQTGTIGNLPWKKDRYAIGSPAKTKVDMPQNSAFLARSCRFAPMFCATKADIDRMYAGDTGIINAHSFSATPTPPEAATPSVPTIAMMARGTVGQQVLERDGRSQAPNPPNPPAVKADILFRKHNR